jgi:hypothetical protein
MANAEEANVWTRFVLLPLFLLLLLPVQAVRAVRAVRALWTVPNQRVAGSSIGAGVACWQIWFRSSRISNISSIM